ncbi:MAG: M48 family metallopeptidase [Chitinophagales bacterium]
MNFKLLNLFLFLGIFYVGIAQNDLFENYKSIEPSGDIPKEFVTKSSERVEDELDDFIQDSKGTDKKYKTEFLINSTFSTRNVLLSGKVLYNDPVTKYINKVADEIFKSNSDLNKNNFRIYAYKSPIVNAFAFNDGLVLVNLGLIAQLENEAQLALILSHEFTHVVNGDAIELYLESKNIDRGVGLYKNTSYDDKMLYKSKYSQEKESTADLQGLDYYKNTKYSLKPINGVFDVLKYAYLPFDDIAFDTTYFETEHYFFPTEYTLKEINPILPDGLEEEDEDEEILKSHPDAEERREAALEQITLAELKDKSKKVYIVSTEAEFKEIRNICRFEMPRMYLMYGYYEMSFYNVYLLEKLGFKNNDYLRRIKAKAITQMARKINLGERPSKSEIAYIKENLQGESQQVYFFLNSLARSKKEFNVFATKYAYKLWQENPKDKILKELYEDIAYRMFDATNIKYKNFKKAKITVQETTNDSLGIVHSKEKIDKREKSEKELLMDEIREENSKYSKIEKKEEEEKIIVEEKKEERKKNKDYYYEYAFAENLTDSKFRTSLKAIEKKYKREDEKTLTDKEKAIERKNAKLDRKRGYALGLDKIVVVNPVFFKIEKDKSNLVKSEAGQEKLITTIAFIDKKIPLDINLLDNRSGEILNTEQFNNASVLNEWVSEQFLYDDNLEFSSIEKNKINRIISAYDTKYFLWTGVVDLKDRKNYTGFFNILFNIETGEVVFKSMKEMRAKASNTLIKSELYHVMHQINKKRKIK